MDAACRVKSDRGYTVAARQFRRGAWLLYTLAARNNASNKHCYLRRYDEGMVFSDNLKKATGARELNTQRTCHYQETGDLTSRCKIFPERRGSA
jgi:hypothetical protein